MSPVMAPEVLADPIGVIVELVLGQEPMLERSVVTTVATTVSGGRAKRRGLAQALLDNPTVLTHGRSPAPRAVGDLLIGLRHAGAATISPPVCADCGKQVRSLQRRGSDWYCELCRPRSKGCASCGQERIVATVDRQGQPRCRQCPDDDDRDPVTLLVDAVTTVDPSLSAPVIAAAAGRVFSRPTKLRRLAWVVEDEPTLLTGEGALAPIRGVLRLIDELTEAGAQTITRPACPGCDRVVRLYRRIGEQWFCRNCVAKNSARPCARCGAVREPAARDEHGDPLCPNCFQSDPSNLEPCTDCGRRRPVRVRTDRGPFCDTCCPDKMRTCSICGRDAPCRISEATGLPWCQACKQRWLRCTGCGEIRPVRGGTLHAPLCATCTRPEPGFWRSCPGCGQPGRIHVGRCARCTVQRRLRELLGTGAGDIPAEWQPLYHALAATDRIHTVESWLDSAAPALLHQLAGQPLSHEALDDLPASKPVEHLRSVLVAIGTLPARDEHLARLQRWITHTLNERPDPHEREMLHRYAVWHVLRRLRHRQTGAETTHEQIVVARDNIKAAIALLDWLTARDRTLTTASQTDLEAWLSSTDTPYRVRAGHFVRWARKQKLTHLDFAAVKWDGPAGTIDTETRWDQARWLLHNDTITPDDRLAGLLVLLYAQRPAAISRLTLDHVHTHDDGQVLLELGSEPVVVPEPLDNLARQVAATRRGHAAIGGHESSPWLFPGGQPDRPISSSQLGKRLRQLGIRPGQSRNTALFQLATDLPAALLARMLGIHITVAVAWQHASAGDWTTYAAEISRRH